MHLATVWDLLKCWRTFSAGAPWRLICSEWFIGSKWYPEAWFQKQTDRFLDIVECLLSLPTAPSLAKSHPSSQQSRLTSPFQLLYCQIRYSFHKIYRPFSPPDSLLLITILCTNNNTSSTPLFSLQSFLLLSPWCNQTQHHLTVFH